MAAETDLKYDPSSFVGPLDLAALRSLERSRTADFPWMTFDPAYVAHVQKFHGGVPGRSWFRTGEGSVLRLGRFVNFTTESTLTPPHQESWLHPGEDIRLQWSLPYLETIANIADGCGVFLVPFGLLYAGEHHSDEMDPTHGDFVCFDYKGAPARPKVVAWFNDAALPEYFRCEEAGLDPLTEMDESQFTEPIADDFEQFIACLSEERP